MCRLSFITIIAVFAVIVSSTAAAERFSVQTGSVIYSVEPATLQIDAATTQSKQLSILPPLHGAEAVAVTATKGAWHWVDSEGRQIQVSTEGEALHVIISGVQGSKLIWPLPTAALESTWLIPDGEGMAYGVGDPFWQKVYQQQRCLGGTTSLSFPAWSYLNGSEAITYALGDGLGSKLCIKDNQGLQARLSHTFSDGTTTLDLLLAVRPAELLAPAFFYRELLLARGQFKTLTDKKVPKLSRLYGAPQVYVWGDGREMEFLDDLKTLGIERINISYDQNPREHQNIIVPKYLARADKMGYLAGPYESFDNAQTPAEADAPSAIWSDDLYPAGCIHDAKGQVVVGFANRGCEMSSEALARHPLAPNPSSRYAGHIADGANQVFLDVDGFGEFYTDYSPMHLMTEARDRANRLKRMGVAIDKFKLVLGSEQVGAWAVNVTHYSHGTAQANARPVWKLLKDQQRFGGWWPSERPALFFKPFTPTADEARELFSPRDRLPLFEAVFHDAMISADRWEFGLMKVAGEEQQRFIRALLYGTPTMWNLDRAELKRVGFWLKAAHDDFRIAHGIAAPLALTGFSWLTPDRNVQQTTYADGRQLIANFGAQPWQGLASNCVRMIRARQAPRDLCSPTNIPK